MKQCMNPFEKFALEYDEWFDSDHGACLFQQELRCIRESISDFSGHWIEIGVGSGRFSAALGITSGVDVSPAMTAIASRRGIRTWTASAEKLPFENCAFDGVLMVCTLCFLKSPQKAIQECCRILRVDGTLVIAFIPANSPWGVYHSERGSKGHAFYASARFHTAETVKEMAHHAGGVFLNKRGCVLPDPKINLPQGLRPDSFVVLSFKKTEEKIKS